MLRVTQTKNSLLDGASIEEELYTTPQDGKDFFENLDKPAKEPTKLEPRNTCWSSTSLNNIKCLTNISIYSHSSRRSDHCEGFRVHGVRKQLKFMKKGLI